ncbi:hypothetical protein BDZ89DRAFT_956602 [Hymenopellis radicata]|nr:hypothetical protein BDZ89DRAFT_956602 [Hymenopellis radicata]
MTKYRLPAEISHARVNPVAPIQVNNELGHGYGFIYLDDKIWVGRGKHKTQFNAVAYSHLSLVVALYSKASGNHASVSDSSNIAAISYMVVQAYEHMHQRQFRAVPTALQHLESRRFPHLPSTAFLCTLDSAPSKVGQLGNLIVSPSDLIRYDNLTRTHLINLKLAMKALAARNSDDID